jgi:HK97 family phage major capsid protein
MSNQWVTEAVTNGESTTVAMADAIGKAATKIEQLATDMESARETDTARWTALNEERKAQAAILTELQTRYEQQRREEETREAIASAAAAKALASQMRSPSKAGAIGARGRVSGYEPGSFFSALMDVASRDPERYSAGKAMLESLTRYEESHGKATLGDSDAAGGWIVPNAIVDTLIKPGTAGNIYRDLMTVVNGVTTPSIDLPYRAGTPARAVIAPYGDTKENVDLAYAGYTAVMYTIARIHDVGAQFLRQSRGAAEQDVMQELASAFALGESYYIREGSGSSQPYGYTGALTNGPAAYRSTFTPSATTLAGSIAASIATAAGALAARSSTPTGAVMAASTFWTMLSQGTDNAGFFFAPSNGPTDIRPGTLVTPFGIPVYPDAAADQIGTGAVVDNLVVANWKAFKIFIGSAYRVDSSAIAGTRWDKNVVGWRGEMDLAFDARPVIYTGHAQMITDILP